MSCVVLTHYLFMLIFRLLKPLHIMKNWPFIPFAILALSAILPACNNSPSKNEDGTLTVNGFTFRDLNKNGKLDAYEDSRQPVEERVNDVLQQMTLEEKAGMMFINGTKVNADGSLDDRPAEGMLAGLMAATKLVDTMKRNHFNLWAIPAPPRELATWYNNLQKYAANTRLGIPITIASDPR